MRTLSRIAVTILMAPAVLLGQDLRAPKVDASLQLRNASTATATIIGVTDRSIDDDFDGLFNSIGITTIANIFEAGTYTNTPSRNSSSKCSSSGFKAPDS